MKPATRPLFPLLLALGAAALITSAPAARAQEAGSAEPVTRAYRITGGLLMGLENPAGAADPFAAPDASASPGAGGSFQDFIAWELDLTFPEGTYARHDPATGKLEIRHQPAVVAAIEAYLRAMERDAPRQLNLRAEIYEMPARAALKIQQLCGPLDDHRPLWQNVQEMVERGQATLVTSSSVIARSGQRAKAQAISEVIYPTEVDWDKEQKTVLPAAFETRNVGTIFEVDPVIGADDHTVDLNFSLEHHTSAPVMRPISVRSPNSGHVVTVEMPEFHAKTLVSQITIGAGGIKCLGAWRPTGGAGEPASEAMQVVFLSVDMQVMRLLSPWSE